jgi:hypothetical protein
MHNAEIVFQGKTVMVTQKTLARMTDAEIAQAKIDTKNAMNSSSDKLQRACFKSGLDILKLPILVQA